MKRAFTLIELIISISIIAIVSTILIPHLSKSYEESKEDIIAIVNSETTIIVIRDNEVIEQGNDLDLSGYKVLDIEYKDRLIFVYVE